MLLKNGNAGALPMCTEKNLKGQESSVIIINRMDMEKFALFPTHQHKIIALVQV